MKYLILVFALISAGCATHRPIVDMQGVDLHQYEVDLTQCTNYAQRIDVGGSAAQSAAASAILGGILGAILCGRNCAGTSAAASGVLGGASGAGAGAEAQRSIVNRCMAGRGYRVLY